MTTAANWIPRTNQETRVDIVVNNASSVTGALDYARTNQDTRGPEAQQRSGCVPSTCACSGEPSLTARSPAGKQYPRCVSRNGALHNSGVHRCEETAPRDLLPSVQRLGQRAADGLSTRLAVSTECLVIPPRVWPPARRCRGPCQELTGGTPPGGIFLFFSSPFIVSCVFS